MSGDLTNYDGSDDACFKKAVDQLWRGVMTEDDRGATMEPTPVLIEKINAYFEELLAGGEYVFRVDGIELWRESKTRQTFALPWRAEWDDHIVVWISLELNGVAMAHGVQRYGRADRITLATPAVKMTT